MKNHINCIFRADASLKIGGGHIMRCLTLADELACQGWHCCFAIRAESTQTVPSLAQSKHEIIEITQHDINEAYEIQSQIGACDWLIVDHYNLDAQFEKAARTFAQKIMVIDDLADRKHDCDLLLDQTYGRNAKDYRELVPEHAQLLMGTDYALLRPEFSALRLKALNRRKKSEAIHRIMVSFGASDPHGMTEKTLQAIKESGLDVSVDVLIGSTDPKIPELTKIIEAMPQPVTFHGFNANMAELMLNADLAIGAGGATSWERCCLGLPTLLIVTADNQEKIARELKMKGAVMFVDNASKLNISSLAKKFVEFSSDENLRHNMILSTSEICDGNGVLRVAEIIRNK